MTLGSTGGELEMTKGEEGWGGEENKVEEGGGERGRWWMGECMEEEEAFFLNCSI